MAYHIYHTPGIIIAKTKTGEANELYTVFTRELGLIRATAQGVRLPKSKLKHALQELTVSEFSIVRGKEIWRITNAKEKFSVFYKYREFPAKVQSAARMLHYLERFVVGEEASVGLYDMVSEFLALLEINDLNQTHMADYDRLATLHVLEHLGYGIKDPIAREIVLAPISMETVSHMASVRRHVDDAVHRAVRESQL